MTSWLVMTPDRLWDIVDADGLRQALGRESAPYRRAMTGLDALWRRLEAHPEVGHKREWWAQLLERAGGTGLATTDLFLQHTYLTIIAKSIATAAVIEAGLLTGGTTTGEGMLSGSEFRDLGLFGAVESDVFDWVLLDPAGDDLVMAIARQVGRFDLRETETDILKGLYESLIDPGQRRDLGEYYTPDWLALRVCAAAIPEPLHQRVMDPACGSGTFLFHAVRRVLAAAATAGMPPAEAVARACQRVVGIDIHPVAVIFARVTCLLALMPELTTDAPGPRPSLVIPVYPGDALQWAEDAHRSGPNRLAGADPNVDVVIGNPPWRSYRTMNKAMQTRFRTEMKAMGLWGGLSSVSGYDLSAVFFARSVQLHLRRRGTIAFVMPYAAMTRKPFTLFRKGTFHGGDREPAQVRFTAAWVFGADVQPLFPVPACVLFAETVAQPPPQPLPQGARLFSGVLPQREASPEEAVRALRVVEAPWPADDRPAAGSVYRHAFRQGAILIPRRLVLVERTVTGVRGRAGNQDKEPWKRLEPPQGAVEAAFIRPVFLGETIAPFRGLCPFEGVVPIDDRNRNILTSERATARGFPALALWLVQVETLWRRHGKGTRSFADQLDFFGQLSGQLPVAPMRIVYSKAGTNPAAALIRDARAIIDHKLYWAALADEREAHYLLAILNSETTRIRAEAWQSQGQWGARDFDKVMFNLAIPKFDEKQPLHLALAGTARHAEQIAAAVPLKPGEHFTRFRRRIREACARDGVSARIDGLVGQLLDGMAER
jgi:hypothetical protein